MSTSRRTTLTAGVLLAVFLTGTVLTLRRVDQLRTGASLEEVLYITSPQVLKRLSLGYNGLLADIYWTRAVQYFGNKHHVQAKHYALLAPLLDITTSLDPHLLVAYEFGANFLSPKPPEGAGMPDKAIYLLEKGIKANPDEWRLYYNLGFVYYWELKDYGKAAAEFERGSHRPNAHPFLKVLAASMAQHAGEYETSRMLWITTFESTQDKQIKLNAVAHLRAIQVDEAIRQLEEIVAQYEKKTGRTPASFADMVRAGFLRGIPVDPDRHPYKLMPDGRVMVENPDEFPFIAKGIPQGYEAPPPNFKNLKPELPNH
jgi:tetratricopeptide (TPR) repeat protein